MQSGSSVIRSAEDDSEIFAKTFIKKEPLWEIAVSEENIPVNEVNECSNISSENVKSDVKAELQATELRGLNENSSWQCNGNIIGDFYDSYSNRKCIDDTFAIGNKHCAALTEIAKTALTEMTSDNFIKRSDGSLELSVRTCNKNQPLTENISKVSEIIKTSENIEPKKESCCLIKEGTKQCHVKETGDLKDPCSDLKDTDDAHASSNQHTTKAINKADKTLTEIEKDSPVKGCIAENSEIPVSLLKREPISGNLISEHMIEVDKHIPISNEVSEIVGTAVDIVPKDIFVKKEPDQTEEETLHCNINTTVTKDFKDFFPSSKNTENKIMSNTEGTAETVKTIKIPLTEIQADNLSIRTCVKNEPVPETTLSQEHTCIAEVDKEDITICLPETDATAYKIDVLPIIVKMEPGLNEEKPQTHPVNVTVDYKDLYSKQECIKDTFVLNNKHNAETKKSDNVKKNILRDVENAEISGLVCDGFMQAVEQNFKEIDEIICSNTGRENGLGLESVRKTIDLEKLKQGPSGKNAPLKEDLPKVQSAVHDYEKSHVLENKTEKSDDIEDMNISSFVEEYTSESDTDTFSDSEIDSSDFETDLEFDIPDNKHNDRTLLNKYNIFDCCVVLKDVNNYTDKTTEMDLKHKTLENQDSEMHKSEKSDNNSKTLKSEYVKCKVCLVEFKGLRSLIIHSRIHLKFNCMCSICGNRYKDDKALERHISRHGNSEFECSICGKILPNERRMKFHGIKHGIKPFQCEQCPKAYHFQSDFDNHKRTHTNERPFQCNLCKTAFTSSRLLHNHLSTTHSDYKYPCEICGKKFKRKEHLESHMNSHSDARLYKCQLCDKTYKNKASLSLHNRSHTGEKVVCEICQRPFRDPGDLRKHYNIHSETKMFQCDICGTSFRSKNTLLRHIKNKHSKTSMIERKFKCGECGKDFEYQSGLIQHMKFHAATKEFECDQCSKSFKFKEWLEKHIARIHNKTDEKFECDECGKEFTAKEGLRKHMKFHKFGRQYKCQICGMSYLHSNHLKRHIEHTHNNVEHKRFTCKICGAEVAHLKSHMETHNDSKPYPCTECGRCFKTEKKLKLHNRVHWDNKPYHCSTCDISFTRRGNWQVHNKKFHNR